MANLHETGWHDDGEVSGWQHHYTNHIKNTNVFTEASRWVAGQFANSTGAYLADVDDDGTQEAVIYNDRVFAVFESIGGKAQWIHAKGERVLESTVVGSDNAYWVDTDGEYNETNHVAMLSDVKRLGLGQGNRALLLPGGDGLRQHGVRAARPRRRDEDGVAHPREPVPEGQVPGQGEARVREGWNLTRSARPHVAREGHLPGVGSRGGEILRVSRTRTRT